MSVFNKTYENLLKDKTVTLDDLPTLVYYLEQLENDSMDYTIKRRLCWWNNTVEFVIEL